jgi:protein-S-isoprenylcysteine O-methyltransferase Ste14
MALVEELERQGNLLFRWRSYLPFLLLPLTVVGFGHRLLLGHSHTPISLRQELQWEIACLIVSMLGLAIRGYTIGYAAAGTSGRNMRSQRADKLNTTGAYSVVRHPLYLANFLVGLGIFSLPGSALVTSIYVLTFWLYYERIMFAEEQFLRRRFKKVFLRWAKQRRAMIPSLRRWRRPSRPFSVRAAIRSEYRTLWGIFATYALLDGLENSIVENRGRMEAAWQIFFVSVTIVCIILRILDKRTQCLA